MIEGLPDTHLRTPGFGTRWESLVSTTPYSSALLGRALSQSVASCNQSCFPKALPSDCEEAHRETCQGRSSLERQE